MRLVYLHQYFNTPRMAGSTRSYQVARRLASAGHEVHIVTSDRDAAPDAPSWRVEHIAGVTVHWTPVAYANEMTYGERMRAFGRFAWVAAMKARRLRPEVIVATSTPLTICLPAAFAAVGRRTPIVLEVRDVWPELPIAIGALPNRSARWAAVTLERFAYCTASSIVALSAGMAESIGRKTSRPVTIIPNGADISEFTAVGREDAKTAVLERHEFLRGRPYVLYAGSVGAINGPAYLVEVACALEARRSPLMLLVVGGGGELNRMRGLAHERGVSERIYFVPAVPKEEIVEYFRGAAVSLSIFVPVPGMEMNSANKYFDSLAAGCPIVVNYGGWQAEEVSEFGLGLVLHNPLVESDVEALDRLADDSSDEWRRAAWACSQIARRRYDRDLLQEAFLDVVESVVHAHYP